MNEANTIEAGERTQELFLVDDRRRKAACHRIVNSEGIIVADVYCDDLAPVFRSALDLLAALKKSHNCATVEADGSCKGCFVSAVIVKAEGK